MKPKGYTDQGNVLVMLSEITKKMMEIVGVFKPVTS